ncbi:hypothetical protein HPB47_004582 [Ixodes persulcatus]|uniref:Uncharacterized protein n=1 Tax=Ixodes persulcatus TaxID=34615 RepID=A0AC60PF94_IXOPE|nr:hypothetical protein HPB47_004582 [Ixodes persulcatus]
MEWVLTKVMEAVPVVISKHVAENARLFRRSGPIPTCPPDPDLPNQAVGSLTPTPRTATPPRGLRLLSSPWGLALGRILYSTPYLHLRKQDEDALEVILRKIFKRALDLPVNTYNQRLLALGMVSTFRELREAHLTNQYTRLSQTESGRRLLARFHIQHTTLMEERVRILTPWRYALHVRPLPAKMTREDHDGRRLARAEALARHYDSKPGVYYVDASSPHHGEWYTDAVVHETKTVNGLSSRARDITHAEEVAIAFATCHPDSKYIISNSRGAWRNVEQGWTPYLAYGILQNSSYIGDPADRYIIWAPAVLTRGWLETRLPTQPPARSLSLWDVSSSPSEQDADPNPA